MNRIKIHCAVSIVLCFVALLAAGQSNGSATNLNVDLVEDRKDTMMAYYPEILKGSIVNGVRDISPRHVLINYNYEGTNYEAVVSKNRRNLKVIARCEQISIDDIPDAVKQGYTRGKLGDNAIKNAYACAVSDSQVVYRLDIEPGKSGRTVSLFYNNRGNPRKAPY